MRLSAAPLILALALTPVYGFAHGEAPAAAHGGVVQEAGEMWLELVVNGDNVTVYVLNEGQKPMPAAQMSGTATVLVNGKGHKVELTPAEGNSLHGTLPVKATGRMVATVSIKAGGKTASARFMPSA